MPQPVAVVRLIGRNFFIRAKAPTIRIGDMEVRHFRILADETTIVLYLFEQPPDNARVTVSYGSGVEGQLEEPFRWS